MSTSAVHSTTDKVKIEAQNILKRSLSLTQDAIQSFGWLYPVMGVPYFWRHEQLRKPLMKMILPSLGISAGVLALMFFFTYLPQAAVLSIFQLGPLGFVTAVGVVLGESGFIINLLLRSFFFNQTLVETFDTVLLINNLDSLVANGRELNTNASSSAKAGGIGKSLGKMLSKPLDKFKPEAIVQYLITIPLNAIPLIGTPVFFAINGIKRGPGLMGRYHQLKKFTPEQKKAFIHEHRGAYTALGTTTMLLELIPVVGPVIFSFSNEVGAALLAVDLEKKQGKVAEGEREIKGGKKKEL